MHTRQNHLIGVFCGNILLVGLVTALFDQEMHIVMRILFGGFCLLTGGSMFVVGLRQLWQARVKIGPIRSASSGHSAKKSSPANRSSRR